MAIIVEEITVPKKIVESPYGGVRIVPDTEATWWQVIAVTETTMTIQVLTNNPTLPNENEIPSGTN